MAERIPATIVTGFLGAGKTTMIRNLLQNANGARIALIVNEFGDVGVDGDLLQGCGDATCTEDDIVELANGCICCTVAEDFVPTIETLLGREKSMARRSAKGALRMIMTRSKRRARLTMRLTMKPRLGSCSKIKLPARI